MRKDLLLLFMVILVSVRLYGNLSFHHLSVNDGLSQLSVLSLYQDELNNIWMGTFAGASRYDGRTFSSFTPHDEHQTPILGNEIISISGDRAGRVFLLSENGLSIINIKNNEIVNIPNSGMTAIRMGKKHLWVAINNQLHFLTPKNQLIKSNIQCSDVEPITAILEHSSGAIWLGSNKGGTIISPGKSDIEIQSCPLITTLYEDRSGNVWIGTGNSGAILVNPKGMIIKTLNRSNGLSNNFIRCIIEDNLRNLWFGSFRGLTQYNPNNNSIINFNNSPFNNYSISHNSVYSLLLDHQQTLWIGTYYGGASYVNMQGNFFQYYSLFDELKKDYAPVMVGCIKEDMKQNIWIATDGAGLKKLDLKTGILKSYTERFGETNYYNNIKSISVDKDNSLWIGVHLKGLYHYDGKRFSYMPIFLSKEIDHYNANIVNDILFFENDLLLATHDGVIRFNKKNHKSAYLFNKDLHEKTGKKVSTIFMDNKKRLWIGTKGQGLSKYDFKTQTFTKFKYSNANNLSTDSAAHQISSNHITQIQQDKSGRIWVATYGGGLNVYDEKSNSFRSCYPDARGQYKYVQSIISLNDSILLLGVKSGIVLYNNITDKIITEIMKTSGLPLEELLDKSLCVTSDNQILVGGKGGIVHFNTTDLITLQPKSEICFSHLFVNNEEILPLQKNGILSQTLPFTKKITLRHNESSFGVNIATHNYLRQFPEEFEFILNGYDENWLKLSNNQNISYNNIPPGKYTLKVRYKNNPSVSSVLDIHILAPWYLSRWAYIIYSIFVIMLAIFFNNLRKTRLQLTMAEHEKQQIKILNQQKLDFFTNISHEFRTPLTLIIGQIESLINAAKLSPSAFRQIQQVQSNAHKLKKLISELLEFHKQEQGYLRLNVYEIDFYAFIKQIFTTFFEYAQHKQIQYTFNTEGTISNLWVDPVQMEKVFYNLLSNAFKFTPSGGSINILCQYLENSVRISIADTGCGIKKSDLQKIFDRFYQSDGVQNTIPGTTGTGIGLSLAKSIISSHHANIEVFSEPEKGSTFTVTLQYGNAHFDPEELKYDQWLIPGETVETWISETRVAESDETTTPVNIEIKGEMSKILIVEDNRDLCVFLQELFSNMYTVITAQNGAEGLQMAKEHQPDLILSDVMMPVMTGTEMCSIIKTHIDTSHIPVVLLTAKTAIEFMINGLQNGADDYICKPFNSNLLLLRCANIINSRRILQQKYNSGNVSYAQSIDALVTTQLDKEFTEKIASVLNNHMHNTNLDVVFLSSEMCMSRTGLYNKIKAIMGITPLELIKNFRLEKSKELILNYPQKPLIDIVEMVGFSSVKYFTKCFKSHFGISPNEFKKKPF